MGTKISAATAVAPSALTAGDIAPFSRAGGGKGKVDLSLLLPPGFAFTKNSANSAEFKALDLANDTGFSASPGAVQATAFRLSVGSWNTTDFASQTYSDSGLVLGFNCKAVAPGDEMRVDTAKHALGIVVDANRKTAWGMESEFAVRFKNAQGTTHYEALRFIFKNSTAEGSSTEFLTDARIGVSGIRGARGCDFLGWTTGATMGWSGAGQFNADVFVASIRQNELLYYYDNGTNYPFINFRMRQISRFEVDFDIGMGVASDINPNLYNSTPDVPQAFVRFGSRPYGASWPNASTMHLGLARDTDNKDAITVVEGSGGVPCILGVYTGNAQPGTRGLVIRGGKRNDTIGANNAALLVIESTANGGSTGTAQWSWGVDGILTVGAGARSANAGLIADIINNFVVVGAVKAVIGGTTRWIPYFSATET